MCAAKREFETPRGSRETKPRKTNMTLCRQPYSRGRCGSEPEDFCAKGLYTGPAKNGLRSKIKWHDPIFFPSVWVTLIYWTWGDPILFRPFAPQRQPSGGTGFQFARGTSKTLCLTRAPPPSTRVRLVVPLVVGPPGANSWVKGGEIRLFKNSIFTTL